MPDVLLIIIACCLALAIGFPINYKNQFSPFNCTLANATYVIACATVHNMEAFPKRVLQCIVGGIIGYFVNYIIFSYRDRVTEIHKNIKASVVDLVSHKCFDTYNKRLELLNKDIGFLIEDSKKGNKKLMYALHDYLLFYEEHKEQLSEQFSTQMQICYQEATAIHCNMLNDMNNMGKTNNIEIPDIHTASMVELSMLGRFIEYVSLLNSVK